MSKLFSSAPARLFSLARRTVRFGAGALAASALVACAEEDGGDPPLTAYDSSVVTYDASQGGYDGSVFSDASIPFDAAVFGDASLSSDAGSSDASSTDAGPSDAGARDAALDGSTADSGARDGGTGDGGVNTGLCPGDAKPHGCYKAKAGNDPKCPAQIYEQSAAYPPFEEWKGCDAPYYKACIYLRPDGSEANCSCDLGLHWLCSY